MSHNVRRVNCARRRHHRHRLCRDRRRPENTPQVFDDASPRLYESLHSFMSSLLCNPAVSPFMIEIVVHGGGSGGRKRVGDGRDRAVVTWPRPLLAGLACLGAHADLGQRELLLVSFSDTLLVTMCVCFVFCLFSRV